MILINITLSYSEARATSEDKKNIRKICRYLDSKMRDGECSMCNSSHGYRTFSGCCNNLKNEKLGEANRAFVRLMQNSYSDSISKPRVGLNASSLPSPRRVSAAIHRQKGKEKSSTISLMLMQFGQFLAHDITLTPEQGLY